MVYGTRCVVLRIETTQLDVRLPLVPFCRCLIWCVPCAPDVGIAANPNYHGPQLRTSFSVRGTVPGAQGSEHSWKYHETEKKGFYMVSRWPCGMRNNLPCALCTYGFPEDGKHQWLPRVRTPSDLSKSGEPPL
jgi:hypothetical protein